MPEKVLLASSHVPYAYPTVLPDYYLPQKRHPVGELLGVLMDECVGYLDAMSLEEIASFVDSMHPTLKRLVWILDKGLFPWSVHDPEAKALNAISLDAAAFTDDMVHESAKPMRKRTSAKGDFWGCSAFPDCKGTRPIGEA